MKASFPGGSDMPGRDRSEPFALVGGFLLDPEYRERKGGVVVDGGRITAILSAGEPPPESCRRVDLDGRVLLPGFCDAHCHLVFTGLLRLRPDLSGARSRREALEILAASLERTDLPEAVIAEGWDESAWPDPRGLTGSDLDAIARSRPVVARRVCTHVAAANLAALEYFDGLPHVDPELGRVYEETAMAADHILPGLEDERHKALQVGIDTALASGLVELHDFGRLGDLERLAHARARGELPLRIRFFLRQEDLQAFERTTFPLDVRSDPVLRLVGVKFFADGSVGARTAAVEEPYTGGGVGELPWEPEALIAAIRAVHDRGLRAAIHAIGDRAVRVSLDCLEATGVRGDRLEHAELISAADLPRLANLGVTASMQPNFIVRWSGPGGLCEAALGRERAARMGRFGSLRRAGVHLAFGSDSMPIGPTVGLPGALMHPVPAERLTVREALDAYTTGGPRSIGETGAAIAVGRPADLCLLSTRTVEPAAFAGATVLATWVGGQLVYEKGDVLA